MIFLFTISKMWFLSATLLYFVMDVVLSESITDEAVHHARVEVSLGQRENFPINFLAQLVVSGRR